MNPTSPTTSTGPGLMDALIETKLCTGGWIKKEKLMEKLAVKNKIFVVL